MWRIGPRNNRSRQCKWNALWLRSIDPYHRRYSVVADAVSPACADAICSDGLPDPAGRVIVTYTTSGSTSLRAARERPLPPILSMTPSLETARRLALVWGVHSVITPDVSTVSEMVERACQSAVQEEFAKQGDTVLISAGMPFGTPARRTSADATI